MTPTGEPWQETFRVRSYEVDPGGHASIQTLCQYCEEVASNHAQVLGFSVEHLAPHRLTWVMTRFHIQVEAYPRWRDTVRVTTWPSGHNGFMAYREYLLYDADDRLLARATSGWVMIDVERRRPTRIPAFIQAMDFPRRTRALEDAFPRLRPPAVDDRFTRSFPVRYSDLDLNRHVNNVRYVEWAVETQPPSFLEAHRLTGLEIHFRAETHYGDTILGTAGTTEDTPDTPVYWHRLRHADGGREVAIARSRWHARPR